MSQFKYDVAVAYRVYPKVSATPPPVYATDKFKLAELCLKSFKASLGDLRVKMWVLLNDCPPAYEALFRQVWSEVDLVVLRYPGVPAGTTLHEQSRILMEQTDAEIVYWAEDDYFYLPGQFQLAVNFLRQNPEADFVSPYDHPDLHTTDLHRLHSPRREFGGKVWQSVVSSTHTMLATRAALVESRRVFLTFHGKVNYDLAMWMALTKRRVFNPIKFLQWLVNHKFWSASIFLAWCFFWRQILFGRRYTLWIPQPAIATHMIATLTAPGIDWLREIAAFEKKSPPSGAPPLPLNQG